MIFSLYDELDKIIDFRRLLALIDRPIVCDTNQDILHFIRDAIARNLEELDPPSAIEEYIHQSFLRDILSLQRLQKVEEMFFFILSLYQEGA
jgi:hypothetical protein